MECIEFYITFHNNQMKWYSPHFPREKTHLPNPFPLMELDANSERSVPMALFCPWSHSFLPMQSYLRTHLVSLALCLLAPTTVPGTAEVLSESLWNKYILISICSFIIHHTQSFYVYPLECLHLGLTFPSTYHLTSTLNTNTNFFSTHNNPVR